MNVFWLEVLIMGVSHLHHTLADSNMTVDCIVQTVRLIARRKIALEFTDDSHDIVSGILQKVNIPVVLNTVEQRKHTGIEHRTSTDVLLLLKDEEPAKILNDTLWNGETRFIIVTQDKEMVENYFEQFWKLKVINVFGMVMTVGNISLYSFLPYGKENCTKPELIMVDSCVDGKLQYGGTALNDLMRIKNMNQCPVNITISNVRPSVIFQPKEGWKNSTICTGFEGNLMTEVAKVYNFNATFKIAEDGYNWGWIHPSPRGAIGDVWRGLTDMTIGMNGPFMERFLFLDLAANYNMDECVTFAVPVGYGAKKAAGLTIFVLEFTYHTWILLILSFMIVTFTFLLTNKYLKGNWFRYKSEVALFLFSSCLGMPVKTPHFLSVRISVMFWIIFTFIVTVSYKASMGSKLAVPPHDPDINTFKELLDSDLEITGQKNMIQILKSEDWPFGDIRKRYRYAEDDINIIVARVASREKVAYLYPLTSFFYFALLNPKARGRVHAMTDCIYIYQPHAILKKYSPFTRRVSQIVRRLEESGIMDMWRATYLRKVPPPKKPFFKLSVEQMFGVFCFLLLGYVFALCCFLREVTLVFGWVQPLSAVFSIAQIKRR